MSSSVPVRRPSDATPERAHATTEHNHNAGGARTPDAALVRRLIDGGREALAVVYAGYADAAFALAERLCGPSAAHDVVDDAFLALWRAVRRGQPLAAGGLRTHVLELTRARALARLHDGDTVGRSYPAWTSADRVSLIALAEEPARGVVARLAPAERHCVEQTYLHGLSVAEIATSSRLPISAVSDRLRRGLRQVRRYLPPSAPSEHTLSRAVAAVEL